VGDSAAQGISLSGAMTERGLAISSDLMLAMKTVIFFLSYLFFERGLAISRYLMLAMKAVLN
jgi:hypothetical protein